MPSLGLQGPYPLDADTIDSSFPRTAPGNYALGHMRKGKFRFDYVGRAETDLNRRLKEHIKSGYSHFKAAYASSLKAAYEKECEHFHDFPHLKNKIHPPPPAGTDWKCPRCPDDSNDDNDSNNS